VNKKRYEKTKVAIEDLNLPFMEVDDFVEEQMKRLHEQHEQWKEQKEANKKFSDSLIEDSMFSFRFSNT